MTLKLYNTVLSGALILATLLASCGGGGGNDAPPTQPPPPPPPMSDLMAPALADAEAQIYTVNVAIPDLVFANGGGGSLSGCSVSPALPAGLSVEPTSNGSTCQLTGTPTAVAEQATYTVTATNATNSDGASIGITVNPRAPSIADAEAQTYTTGTAIPDLAFANGGGGALTGCSVDPALPTGLSLDRTSDNTTCQLSGTPTAESVQTTYTVTATNVTGEDNASISITTNPPLPVLADAEAQTYIRDMTISDLVLANNGGGSLTACSADPDLPTGLIFERSSNNLSCRLSGTPTVESAQRTYSLTATNAAGGGNASVVITVNPPLPSLADVDGQHYLMDETITELVFTNNGGTSLTGCTVDPELPDGLTFERFSDNATCRLIGMPTAATAQAPYTFTATNATGSADVSVGVTVHRFTLTLVENQDQVLTIGKEVALSFTNNGGGALTECASEPALPAGLTVELSSGDVSCEITGIPLLLNAQTDYVVIGTNSMGSGIGSGIARVPLTVANVFLPDSVTVAMDGATAELSWTALATATGYEVWRAEVGDGEQISRVRESAAETTFTNTGLTAGTDYYYLIAECTALGCADPSATGPVAVGSLTDDGSTELFGPSGITTTTIGGRIYALVSAGFDNSIQIIDISTPSTLTAVGSLTDTDQTGLELDGAFSITTTTIEGKFYALVTAEVDNGVQIIDVGNPSAPEPVSSIDDSQEGGLILEDPRGITTAAIGDSIYALIASFGENGIQIIDVGNPAAPNAVGSLDDSDSGGLELEGARDVTTATIGNKTYALVASATDDGIQFIDISTPSTPTAVGSLTDTDQTRLNGANSIATAVIGGRIYAVVASLSDGIQIIDVTTPQRVMPANLSP